MKILLAAAMTLGVLFILGANQPTQAVVIQSVEPTIQQDHVIPAYWHRWHHWHHWGWRHHHHGWWRW